MARTASTEAQVALWERDLEALRAEPLEAVPSYARAALRERISSLEMNIAGARNYIELAEQIDNAGPFTVAEAHVGGVTLYFQRGKLTLLHGTYENRGAH